MSRYATPVFLLVEDNPADVALIHEILDEFSLAHECVTARDGVEAVAHLRDASSPLPDFVLLDLNLPRMDGREVLREIRGDPALSHLPVIIHSTSGAVADVNDAYRMHANSYVQKARTLDEFREKVRSVVRYWLSTVTLPIEVRDLRQR